MNSFLNCQVSLKCFSPKKLEKENDNSWFQPWFNILLHSKSIVCVTVFWVLGIYNFVLGMKSDFLLILFFCFLIATLGIRIFLTVIKGGRVYLFLSICNCNNALIYFGSDILDLKTNMRSPSRYCTIISGGVITWLMVGLTYGLFLGCSSSNWPACKSCCLNNS